MLQSIVGGGMDLRTELLPTKMLFANPCDCFAHPSYCTQNRAAPLHFLVSFLLKQLLNGRQERYIQHFLPLFLMNTLDPPCSSGANTVGSTTLIEQPYDVPSFTRPPSGPLKNRFESCSYALAMRHEIQRIVDTGHHSTPWKRLPLFVRGFVVKISLPRATVALNEELVLIGRKVGGFRQLWEPNEQLFLAGPIVEYLNTTLPMMHVLISTGRPIHLG